MISINNLSLSYGKKEVFKNLNLEISCGLYGLLGKNGAGKSSLFKIISGQIFSQNKDIKVGGFAPWKRDPRMLEKIFYLPEEFILPGITSEKFVSLNSVFYPKFDHDFFKMCMNSFEVELNSKLSGMSYGQRKKFMISFALATFSEILLLDEPTNGLDIPSKSNFRRLAASAASDDRTIIISTHQARDMEGLIDPIIILNNGRVIFNNALNEIEKNFRITRCSSLPDETDIFYFEKDLSGYTVALLEKSFCGSFYNLEFVFNMIHAKHKEINSIINGES